MSHSRDSWKQGLQECYRSLTEGQVIKNPPAGRFNIPPLSVNPRIAYATIRASGLGPIEVPG